MWPRGRGNGPRGRGHRGSMRSRGAHGNFHGRGSGRGMGLRGGYINKNLRPYNKSFVPRKFNKPEPGERSVLNEIDAGISEYVSTCEGFAGILKARYSDFHVNEIDLDGNISKLTNLSVPIDPEPEIEEDDESVVSRYRIEQLPIETWDKLHNLVQNKKRDEVIEIEVTDASKEERTKIHDAVRTVFGRKIVRQTLDKDDKKFITFKLFNKHDKVDQRSRWPATRGGEYVYFLVHKQQTDTIEANIMISEALSMKAAHFSYAGVKDRRAKTTQWFSVRKVEPQRIVDSIKKLPNIHIGNFCYKKETLKLGQLKGNRFRIALREITAENSLIETALVSLKDNGFINYYGLQRFGNNKEIPTYTIGVELLKGNWAEAISLILKPRKFERMGDVADAKLTYQETGDANEALSKLRRNRNKSLEGKLISGLASHGPTDYVNALENVPRNMRLLYIHAYQSLVWNNMVSRRIKEFGLKPIIGDLIVEEDNSEGIWESVETEVPETFKNNDSQKVEQRQPVKVKSLTKDDLNKYTIYDVVLPLPGYDISYPDNVVKDWYKEYLEKDGLSLEMPKQKVKTYTLSGAYRKILEKVTDMSWEFMQYKDTTSNLIRSDIEELRGQPKPQSCEDGKYKALIVDFCLPSSCYATIALRELMKIDLSWNEAPKNKKIKKETNNSESSNKNEDVKEETKTKEDNTEMIAVTTEDIKTEPKLLIKKVEVVTKAEIETAKKEFMQNEIAELEDEIWAVMQNDETTTDDSKRKLDTEETNENKKIKCDPNNV